MQRIHGHLFVPRWRPQRITTGQIHHPEFLAMRREGLTGFEFHGHTGIVPDPFVSPRQRIEQRGFPGVRIPYQGDCR